MTITPLIVTNRQEFFRKCVSALRIHGIDAHLAAHQGQEVREKLRLIQPNLILVDVSLAENTARLLENLTPSVLQVKPAIFLSLGGRTPGWERFFLKMGAMYVFDQAMGEAVIVECMLGLYSLYRWTERTEELLPELVQILRDCRISSRHRGYACIFDSVQLIYHQPGYMQSLTKKIYPHVAKLYDTTASRVEKNIRDAIRNAWENGGKAPMCELLGCGDTKPPSNGQLIGAVCEKLREIIYRKESGNALPLTF